MCEPIGSLILCVTSLTYIIAIGLCVLCVSVVLHTHCLKAPFQVPQSLVTNIAKVTEKG
ncbi:conserved hypothetical protein [Microcystis aeruginosa PCC 7941]|nr:conserved hypothetical protein [Microcystis aeruginosa PCC 7941]